MNVAIVGYGKMGKLIEEVLGESKEHVIKTVVGRGRGDPLTARALEGVDVAIDFSHGSLMERHIQLYCESDVSAVVGTTGWNAHSTALRDMVEDAGISIIVGSNFSPGVQSFIRIVRETAKRLAELGGYDVYIQDIHHAHKADSPSGTARTIAEALLETFPMKTDIMYGQPEGRIAEDVLQVVSIRGGLNAGTHHVTFDSADDTITLTHTSHGRRGFAAGAVKAISLLERRSGWIQYEEVFEKESI